MCKAVLLAKYITEDLRTGMYSIAGIYCAILVTELPKTQSAILVYAKLCDLEVGDHVIRFRICDPDGIPIATSGSGRLESGSELAEAGVDLGFPEVVFHKEGRHEVQCLDNDEIVGTTKLDVKVTKEG